MKKQNVCLLALALSASLFACGGDDASGTGRLTVTTWGEDFIEKEIPASEVDGGHRVVFSKVLLALSALRIADHEGKLGGEVAGQHIYDLHPAGPHELAVFEQLGAQRWDRVGIHISPAQQASAGNATAADVTLMNDQGYSVYVAGRIEPAGGATPLSFAWGFATTTSYSECHDAEGQEGIVVPTGGSVTMQFTIHGDHFFYDSLQGGATLRAAALLAADADGDGDLTLDELAAVDLTTLPIQQYDTGGAGSVRNLADFLSALSRTLVHYQGEGNCHSGH